MYLAIFTAIMAAFAGYQQMQQGKYQEKVSEFNAREQENEATRIRNKGVEEEIAHRNKVSKVLGQQRAQLAASGVDISSGSAADLQDSTIVEGEADALRIRSNFEDQADAMERQSVLTLMEGRSARSAANMEGTSTILGASQFASKSGVVNKKWYAPDSVATGGIANA